MNSLNPCNYFRIPNGNRKQDEAAGSYQSYTMKVLVKSCDSSRTMSWIKADMGMCTRSNMILRNTFLSGLFPVSDLQGLLDAVTIREQVCDATSAPVFMK